MSYPNLRFAKPERSDRAGLVTAVAAGLGIGLLAGIILGEIFGGERRESIKSLLPWGRRPPVRRPVSALTRSVEQALRTDTTLRDLALRALPIGRQALELQGWVPSRSLRSHALRLAATTAGPLVRVVDGLLVRGEDDRHDPEPDPTEEPQTA